MAGLEPARDEPLEPKSSASTNSATFAKVEKSLVVRPERFERPTLRFEA